MELLKRAIALVAELVRSGNLDGALEVCDLVAPPPSPHSPTEMVLTPAVRRTEKYRRTHRPRPRTPRPEPMPVETPPPTPEPETTKTPAQADESPEDDEDDDGPLMTTRVEVLPGGPAAQALEEEWNERKRAAVLADADLNFS